MMSILDLYHNQKGFTALELIVITAIISIIVLGLNSLIISGYSNFRLLNDRAEIQRSIRLLDTIVNDNIRYAESVKIKNTGKPTGKSNYDHVLELSPRENNAHRILYNGKAVTDNIVKNMSADLSTSRLDLEIEFTNNQIISFYTILANLDSK